jgi:hypothetical protein
MDRIHLSQHKDQKRALVNTVMNVRVPKKAGNFLTGCGIISISTRILLHEFGCLYKPEACKDNIEMNP